MHKILIIGSGDMGREHVKAWTARTDAKIVAVCGNGGPRSTELGAELGAAVYNNWEEAIQHEGLTIVDICTPTVTHAPIAIASAKLKRHIICEKPMALSLDEADAMIEAAKENNVLLTVSHHYRTIGRFQYYQDLVKDGKLGEGPFMLRLVDMREVRPKLAMHSGAMNGGPVHDMSGHFVDAAQAIFGSKVIEVSASGSVYAQGKERVAEVSDLALDSAEILLRFEDGSSASLNVSWGLPEGTPDYGHELLQGALGFARCEANGMTEGDRPTIHLHTASGVDSFEAPKDPLARPSLRIAELVDAIDNGTPLQITGESAKETLNIILAIKESAATGRAVVL